MKDDKPEDKHGTLLKMHDAQECPTCKTRMERRMFRTGSTKHPGQDMLVCVSCGKKQHDHCQN